MSTPFKHLPRVRSMPAPLSRAVQYPSPFHRTLRHQSSGQVQQFLDAVKSRRTYYELGRDAPVDHRTIFETLKTAILHCPSSFNSQTARLVVLFNSHHERLWQITSEVLEAVVPPENFEPTAKKIEGLRSGYGTVLFYEDPCPTKELQERMPLYASKFPLWAEQSNAMLQYILWTALEAHGFGCNLQHYNPLIDEKVATEWNVHPEWNLKGQLVFGSIKGPPKEKTYRPWEERISIHGTE